MNSKRSGIAKAVIAVVLIALAAAAFLFMTQEQKARDMAETACQKLSDKIDEGLGPDEVHQLLNVEPSNVREPNKNRMIEEFTWRGPFSEHTVYAYYQVAATKLLEATSLNKKLDEWEE